VKQKIVFMVINMNIGGTEKALLNLINEMPKDRYEITVLLLEKRGGFLEAIPDGVRVEYVTEYPAIKKMLHHAPHRTILEKIRAGKFIQAFNLTLLYGVAKVKKERSLYYQYVLKDIAPLQTNYDLAVAYAGPMDLITYFVAKKIQATKKAQWIHFDIDKIGFTKHFAKKWYPQFDKVFVVSAEGKAKFIDKLPGLQSKTAVFLNTISPTVIQEEAVKGPGFQDDFTGIRILTVGRLTMEKGQDLAIKALAKLIDAGYNVRWYCVGDGGARKEYERMVDHHGLHDHFVFLGADANPYTYMKDCDIYVQPSRHEGYCITLAEAKILKKPIITTDFTGAMEQIEHGKTGLIVPVVAQQLYEAIKQVINHPELIDEFSLNLAQQATHRHTEWWKMKQLL